MDGNQKAQWFDKFVRDKFGRWMKAPEKPTVPNQSGGKGGDREV